MEYNSVLQAIGKGTAMTTGERIRKARKKAGLTQRALGEKIGLSAPAIRLYELGKRTPSDEVIGKIAKALEVAPESLEEYNIESARDALEVLFRLKEFGIAPCEDGSLKVVADDEKSRKIQLAIRKWYEAEKALADREMSEEDYEYWMQRFDG